MAQDFDAFVASASPRLIRTARMLLGSATEAPDLAQESLIVVFRHWARLRDPQAAESYAYTALIRLVRRHLRRARFRHEVFLADTPEEVRHEHQSAPAGGDDVTNAVALLPDRQREAIVLRYYLDFSIDRTAQVMRCSPGTVKSQVSKGLAALRQQLEQKSRVGEA